MLQERAETVHEMVVRKSNPLLMKFKRMMQGKLPDLEKALVRIQYANVSIDMSQAQIWFLY